MRHKNSGRKLSRNSSHRQAMLRNMAASLFIHGAIRTTEAKAKELARVADKLVTLTKRDDLHSRRLAIIELTRKAEAAAPEKTEKAAEEKPAKAKAAPKTPKAPKAAKPAETAEEKPAKAPRKKKADAPAEEAAKAE